MANEGTSVENGWKEQSSGQPQDPMFSALRQIVRPLRPYASSLALLAIVLLYCVLALHRLPTQDPHTDELITMVSMRLPTLSQIAHERLQHGHPPIYFILAKLWRDLAGHHYDTLLLLTIALGGAGIFVCYGLARALRLGAWAFVAALFWALHPTLQHYARFARPYVGNMVIASLILWATLAALERRSARSYWLLLGVGMLGSLWNMLFGLVWVGIVLAVAGLPRLRRCTRPGFWLALGGQFLFYALCAIVVSKIIRPGRLDWIPRPTLGELLCVHGHLLGGVEPDSLAPSWKWIVPLIMVIALAAGLVRILRRQTQPVPAGESRPEPALSAQDRWRLIALGTFTPALIMLIMTYTSQPVLIHRYMTIFFPGLLLFLVWFLAHIKRRRIAIVTTVLIAGLLIHGTRYDVRHRKSGVRDCVKQLARQYQPGDTVVVFKSLTREAVRLFAHKKKMDLVIGQQSADTRKAFDSISAGLASHKRVWVLGLGELRPLLDSPQWQQAVTGPEFFKLKEKRVQLYGYHLRQPTPTQPRQLGVSSAH